jgi:8-oxo-dGTP diphosphatase
MAEPTQIAIGLIWSGNRLLVGRRTEGQTLAGYHEFPGGKCAPDETPEHAVVRECREETGLDVTVLGLRVETGHEYPHGRLRLFFFDCALADEIEADEPRPPFAWADVPDVLEMTFPPANRPVLESVGKRPAPIPRPSRQDLL